MEGRIPEKIIDFHVHLFPDRMFDAIWKYFTDKYRWDVIYRMYTPECIAFLKEKGVETIVYSNYAHTKGVARPLNQWNHRVLDAYDGLYCFAAFHPDDDGSLAIAEEALSHPKVLGFKLQLLVQRFFPHDKRMFPLYEMVRERGKRILFHAGTGPVGNEFVGIDNFRHVMEAFPDLKATVAHMGALEYAQFMALAGECEDLYLDTAFAFLKKLPGTFDLAVADLEKNASRVLYGSDFPNCILPREEEIDALRVSGLSNCALERIFYLNGREIIAKSGSD